MLRRQARPARTRMSDYIRARFRRRLPIVAITPGRPPRGRSQQHTRSDAQAAERERDQLDDAKSQREQHDDQDDDQRSPAHAREDAGGASRDEQAHRPQREHLPSARRGLAEALDGVLEDPGAAFGQRQGRIGHPPQLHPLLRAGGGDRHAGSRRAPPRRRTAPMRVRQDHQAADLYFVSFSAGPRPSAAPAPGSPRTATLFHPDLSLFGGHRTVIATVCAAATDCGSMRRRLVGRPDGGRLCAEELGSGAFHRRVRRYSRLRVTPAFQVFAGSATHGSCAVCAP